MFPTGRDRSDFAFAALYAAAAFVLADQLSDLAASLYPFQLGQVNWRFGAFGLATGRLTTLVMVDAFLLIAALGRNDWRFIRVLALLHVPVGLFFLVCLPVFVLDTIELRRAVTAEASRGLLLASARATLMAITAAVFCFWAAATGLKASRRPASASPAGGPVIIRAAS